MPGLRGLSSVVALLVAAAPAAFGQQSWPTKPVRMIVSVGLGTGPDVVTRLVADRLSRSFGRSFFVENMPGGAGHIAAQAAARAAPDGYTYFLAGAGIVAIDRYLFKTLPYDADRDFVPVGRVYDTGAIAIAVHPDLPVKTVSDLIALTKASPDKYSYGVDGSLGPIIGEWFVRVAGTPMVAVPYKGPGPMLQDATMGRTQVVFGSIAALDVSRRAGKLRVIGVGTTKRFPGLEEIPTISETIPGFRAGGLGLLVAPAGTAAEIRQRLNREMDPIIRDAEYQERLRTFGFTASNAGTPESIAEFIREERELWDRVMRTVGFKPQ
jgi:tripartite-type tricarboxylate transporter receptor subunit TctC